MDESRHDGHRQRLRERFLAEGIDSFQPHEVLEFLLFFGIPRKDTNELAHQLIRTFGSLSEVLDAPYEELRRIKGMTAGAAVLLKTIPAAGRAYLLDRHAAPLVMDSPKALGEYFVDRFFGETAELVWLLCLDSSLNVIACEQVARGTVTVAQAPARKIAELTLRHNSSRVVLAHNHPRGMAIPSNEDIISTRCLCACLRGIEIELVDHIIVAGRDYVSLRNRYPSALE